MVIPIPTVTSDERIGSVFNSLFVVIDLTDRAVEDDVVWDFSGAMFFHPFFLAPLSVYKQRCMKNITIQGCSDQVKRYLDAICFEAPYRISSEESVRHISSYVQKKYTPICSFSAQDVVAADLLQNHLQEVVRQQTNYGSELQTPLTYLLSEIVCNIQQHADAERGYIYCQYLKQENCIDLCIADDGITVLGSYLKANKYLDEIMDNEALALRYANDGYSTKDVPERGFGLITTKKLLVDGLGGEFFMLSGGAFLRQSRLRDDCINLPKTLQWEGTIILMRIPITVKPSFNFYDYIE